MKSDKKEKKKVKKKKNKDKKLTVKDAKQIKESRQANDLDQQITLSLNDQQEQVQPFVQYNEEPKSSVIQPNVQYGNQNHRNNNYQQKNTIDLFELFSYLCEQIKIMVLVILVCGLLGFGYFKFFTNPVYASTSKLYVRTEQTENTNNLVNDLQAGSQLSVDYKEVFNNWEVTDNVKNKLDVNYSDSALQSMISISIPDNTRIIAITAQTNSAQFSADLANAYADAAKEFIEQNMSTAEPSIFSTAQVPDKSVSNGMIHYILLFSLCGFAFVFLILIIRFIFDNRPKAPDDLAKVTGVPTLAVIPEEDRKKGRRS